MPTTTRPKPATSGDISALLALARQEFDDASELSASDIREWIERKSPTLVVHDAAGRLVGYARSKPNEALGVSRTAGQTAVLTHIAVVSAHRGAGIGRTLHDRSIRTLELLGYSRVFAQVPQHLVNWYQELGWTVHPAGETVAWIEPPNIQDDALAPGVTPRAFAPILCMEFLPRYPVLIERWIGTARPLLDWTLDGRVARQKLPAILETSLAQVLLKDPKLAKRMPTALCDAIIATNADGQLARTLLKLGR